MTPRILIITIHLLAVWSFQEPNDETAKSASFGSWKLPDVPFSDIGIIVYFQETDWNLPPCCKYGFFFLLGFSFSYLGRRKDLISEERAIVFLVLFIRTEGCRFPEGTVTYVYSASVPSDSETGTMVPLTVSGDGEARPFRERFSYFCGF